MYYPFRRRPTFFSGRGDISELWPLILNQGTFKPDEDSEASEDEEKAGFEEDADAAVARVQARDVDDELGADLLVFIDDQALADFVNNEQPRDKDRHKLVLISLLRSKARWVAADLQNEHYLRVGLQLLYNKMQGRNLLAISKSVHVEYDAFRAKDVKRMVDRMRRIGSTKQKLVDNMLELHNSTQVVETNGGIEEDSLAPPIDPEQPAA